VGSSAGLTSIAGRVQDAAPIVIGIGGNALVDDGNPGGGKEQLVRAHQTANQLISILSSGRPIAIVHGNGPQVGYILQREEMSSPGLPAQSLDVCGSESQGQIGYALQQAFGNVLQAALVSRQVIAVVTQVEVSIEDPAFLSPSKPIGSFYSEEEATAASVDRGWQMVQDSGRGWRRVVASPRPKSIVEAQVIARLVKMGIVTICAGGGGIPVIARDGGGLVGVAAVIDKDYASALVAKEIGAELLTITTPVEHVSLDFGTIRQRPIGRISAEHMERHLREGQFPVGSMAPKVDAALEFLRSGGRHVIITDPEHLAAALAGRTGTWIVA
jgi:carbamate kinase